MKRDTSSIVGALLIVTGVCAGLPREPWWRIAIVSLLIYVGARFLA